MSSYLDILPGNEREKIRKKLRSPEAYQQLRERVKGPEDLEKEMKRSERLAELHFAMETEGRLKDSVKESIREQIQEDGMESVLESVDLPETVLKDLEEGKFDVRVESHPDTHVDTLVLLPEGKVQEKIPVTLTLSDKIISQSLSSDIVSEEGK